MEGIGKLLAYINKNKINLKHNLHYCPSGVLMDDRPISSGFQTRFYIQNDTHKLGVILQLSDK